MIQTRNQKGPSTVFLRMQHYNYQDTFKQLFETAVSQFERGNRDKDSYFSNDEQSQIAANGWRIQDFFDYAEDLNKWGEPTYEIAQSIEQVRREYFLHKLDGKSSSNQVSVSELPAKSDSLGGITWLPRILTKARGKLLGELPNEIMYCCGGDRHFLETHDIHPSEFLRVVWANWDNDHDVLEFVKSRSPAI